MKPNLLLLKDDQEIRGMLQVCLASDERTASSELALLESVGLASVRGTLGAFEPLPDRLGEYPKELAEKALSAISWDALEETVQDLMIALRDLRASPGSPGAETVKAIRAGLATRDRVELQLIGFERVVGLAPILVDEAQGSLLTFEDGVGPELWQIVAMNEMRAQVTSKIKVKYRNAFWWWSRGNDFPRDILDELSAAAGFLAIFPEARAYLDRLISTSRLIDLARVEPAAESGKVISLSEWLSSKTGSADDDVPTSRDQKLAAGFAEGETKILERRDLEVSWSPPDVLVVDLIADPVATSRPRLEIGDRSIDGEPVPDCVERYAFRLTPTDLAQQEATLHVRFRDGPLALTLRSPER